MLPKKSDSGRVILDQAAKLALEHMLSDLKTRESCLRISPSKLVSWMVERYSKQSFASDRELIIKAHFNSKEYLRNVIQGLGADDDASEVLQAALQRIKPTGDKMPLRRGRKKRAHSTGAAEGIESLDLPSGN